MNLTSKNVPRELYDRLKRSAEHHRRSLNSEVILRLEEATGSRPRDVEAWLADARAAPLLWRSEVRNVLVGYGRRGALAAPQMLGLMDRAERLLRGREFLPGSARVLELADRSRLSAYDCEYVALAEELDVPLVTSDRRVAEAFSQRVHSPASFLAS